MFNNQQFAHRCCSVLQRSIEAVVIKSTPKHWFHVSSVLSLHCDELQYCFVDNNRKHLKHEIKIDITTRIVNLYKYSY